MKKRRKIICAICFIFFLGTIGLFISMDSIDNKTEHNTTEFSATVKNVKTTYTGKTQYIDIYTEEYTCKLYVTASICKRINSNDINNLQRGDIIFFRIENDMLEQFNIDNNFCNIVSLKTAEKEIFTLSSYNTYMQEVAYPARIASVILSTIFLIISMRYILLIRGISFFRIREDN